MSKPSPFKLKLWRCLWN